MPIFTKRKHTSGLTLVVAAMLLIVGGCGPTREDAPGSPTTQPKDGAAQATIEQPVPTGYAAIRPVATGGAAIMPDGVATREMVAATAITMQATSVAYARSWVDRLELNGDSPEAEEALNRWKEAIRGVKSVRGSQLLMQIEPDGTRHPRPEDQYYGLIGTDERYDGLDTPEVSPRYYVAAHTRRGDFITSYDGREGYRTWTWMNDIFQPLPDTSASHAYWADDIDSTAFLHMLRPTRATYSYAGKRKLDGRSVVELVVKQGNYADGGMTGTHVFLDEATYLPYRLSFYPTSKTSRAATGGERTFTRLEINIPMSDADFRPPFGADTRIIHEPVQPGWTGYTIPAFASVVEAQKEAGVPLFTPGGTWEGEVPVWGFVEQDGKRVPIVSFMDGTILEGVYLPQITEDGTRFSMRASARLGEIESTSIKVGGLDAEWQTVNGTDLLRMVRDGTSIEIRASSQEEAIGIAEGLKPVGR